MKVLVITGGFPSEDNPAKSIFNYRAVIGLKKIIDVKVVHFRYWKPGRRLKQLVKFGKLDVITLALPWMPINNARINAINLLIWKRISLFLLKEEIYSVQLIHSIGLETAPIGSFISKRSKIPHVAQAIGSDLLFYLPQKERYFGIRNWVSNTKAVICNSKYLMKEVKKRYPSMRAEVAYRGTNLLKFKQQRPKNPGLTLLYLGGFSNRKGTGLGSNLKGGETLKLIWEIIDRDYKIKADLLLAGPQSNSAWLRAWVEKLRVPNQVTLLGQIPPEKVPHIMGEADIVLIPSLSEGLPNVAVEACAGKKLVLASKVGGIPEVIQDNKTGLLLEAGNVDQWVTAIVEVLKNFESYREMSTQAKKFVQSNFNAKNYPYNLLKIYNEQLLDI